MRIRTIKPEFYQDEQLATVPREVRDLAKALISCSDDEGWFRSHPAIIAGTCYPFDDDGQPFVKSGLEQLAAIGYLELHEGGVGYLPGFTRHQVINKPSKSKLKGKSSGRIPVGLPEDSHTEGEQGTGNREVEGEQGSLAGQPPADRAPEPEVADTGVSDLALAWNAKRAPTMPEWRFTKPPRQKAARARINEHGLAVLVGAIERCARSEFASGRKGEWSATPDWLLKPVNLTKVLEGNYDNRSTGPPRGVMPVDHHTETHTENLT